MHTHHFIKTQNIFFRMLWTDSSGDSVQLVGNELGKQMNRQTHMITGKIVEMGTGFTLCLSLVLPSFSNVCF